MNTCWNQLFTWILGGLFVRSMFNFLFIYFIIVNVYSNFQNIEDKNINFFNSKIKENDLLEPKQMYKFIVIMSNL